MVPLITSDHEPTDACRAVSNGFANFRAGRRAAGSGDKARPTNAKRQAKRAAEGKGASAAEGEGPSAAPTERDGWIGPGGRPVPGETSQMGLAMANAAHQRVGQMRDGKRARPE